MKNFFLLAFLFTIGMMMIACQADQKETADADQPDAPVVATMTKADSVKRGEYLSHIMGCNDCHSPKLMTDKGPVPDPERLMSGHPANEPLPKITDKGMIAPGQWMLMSGGMTAAVGPWGTSFAANLTPHETGTGNWTLENFSKALREGKAKGMDGGRALLPPMPWPNYATLSDEDLANLWQYIRSLKPVENVVPNPLPPA